MRTSGSSSKRRSSSRTPVGRPVVGRWQSALRSPHVTIELLGIRVSGSPTPRIGRIRATSPRKHLQEVKTSYLPPPAAPPPTGPSRLPPPNPTSQPPRRCVAIGRPNLPLAAGLARSGPTRRKLSRDGWGGGRASRGRTLPEMGQEVKSPDSERALPGREGRWRGRVQLRGGVPEGLRSQPRSGSRSGSPAGPGPPAAPAPPRSS